MYLFSIFKIWIISFIPLYIAIRLNESDTVYLWMASQWG